MRRTYHDLKHEKTALRSEQFMQISGAPDSNISQAFRFGASVAPRVAASMGATCTPTKVPKQYSSRPQQKFQYGTQGYLITVPAEQHASAAPATYIVVQERGRTRTRQMEKHEREGSNYMQEGREECRRAENQYREHEMQ